MAKRYLITDFGATTEASENTAAIQSAIDTCFLAGGGEVVIPAGVFLTGDIRLRSHVTLYLKAGAVLRGIRDPLAYYHYQSDTVEPLPPAWYAGNTPEMTEKQDFHGGKIPPGCRWCHGLIRAIHAEDVAIVGEAGAVIDGNDCYDAIGEEHYRGPHAISMEDCRNIRFSGYTVKNSANWAHAIFHSENIHMRNVTVRAGHDGVHFTTCRNMTVEDCAFYTGDDCVAGLDLVNVHVKGCILNTACSAFRMGGTNVYIEDCHMYGPAAYLFRGSLTPEEKAASMPSLANPGGITRDTVGHRFNMLSAYTYYADFTSDIPVAPGNVVMENCRIENADRLVHYNYSGNEPWQKNKPLHSLRLSGIRATGVTLPLNVYGDRENPIRMEITDSEIHFREDVETDAFCHLCHHDWFRLQNTTITYKGDGALVKTWSDAGEIRMENLTAPSGKIVKADEPFFAQAI